MIRKIDLIPGYAKFLLVLTYDLFALSSAFFLAYFLRLGATNLHITWAEWSVFITVCLGTLLIFNFAGIYRTVIRYFTAKSVIKVVAILVVSTLLFYFSSTLR